MVTKRLLSAGEEESVGVAVRDQVQLCVGLAFKD